MNILVLRVDGNEDEVLIRPILPMECLLIKKNSQKTGYYMVFFILRTHDMYYKTLKSAFCFVYYASLLLSLHEFLSGFLILLLNDMSSGISHR